MNIFRKSIAERPVQHDYGSRTVNDTVIMETKEVLDKGHSEPTTYVEVKKVNLDDYAKQLSMPTDDEYQLRDMLKAGQIPQEVPVSGMLDSQDPTDLKNVGVGDSIFNELANDVDSRTSSSKPAPAVEPAQVVEPNE